ncbi:monocarboxylate transporter 12-like [Haemaphysalis longicornis]
MSKPSETRNTSSVQMLAHLQDRCWLVPIVAALAMFLTSTINSSKGYLYVLCMDHYGVDHKTASWLGSAILISEVIVGFGIALFQTKVSVFWLTMLSVATASAGAIGGAFCQNMLWFSVAMGGVYGVGYGAALTCFALYTMLYFDKYKATATGVKYAAMAASGLAGPVIMSLLVGRYGFPGALLLCGAITMQAAPLVMLLKQPGPFKFLCFHVGKEKQQNPSGENKQRQKISAIEIPQLHTIPVILPVSPVYQPRATVGMAGISVESVAGLLVIPEFSVLVLVYFLNDWTSVTHATTVVDYGRDKGAPLEDANYLQTYSAVGGLLGRLVVPYLSDKVICGHSLFAAFSMLGSAIAVLGMTFNQSFVCFATLNALFGACEGYVQCMRSVLVTRYLCLEHLPLFYGCVGLFLLPVSLGNPTILGFYRDTLGSYDNLYLIFGGVNTLISLPLFLIALRDRARNKDWLVHQDSGLLAV